MSTIKNPVGPHSRSVYRRRRLVVLLGLIAVITAIVLIIVGRGSADDSLAASPSPKPSQGASTTPSASAAPGAADGANCTAAQVTVEAITDANIYAAGELPLLSLSVTNTGTNDCVLDVGTSQQVYAITSGKDQYWSSTDCQEDATEAKVLLKVGATEKSADPIKWDRTRSAPDTCADESRPAVPADGASYYLTTKVGDIVSAEPKQFLLN